MMEKPVSEEGVLASVDESSDADATADELVIAHIAGFDDAGRVLVSYAHAGSLLTRAAISTVTLHPGSIGRQVAIMFVGQNPDQPIVIGLIKSRLDDLLEALEPQQLEPQELEHEASVAGERKPKSEQKLTVDGKSVTIEGEDEIVLKCGESSITLTKSGKILIRGKYLLNRSTGVNRIMGGSVQVN